MAALRHADTPRQNETVTTSQAPHTPLPWTYARLRSARLIWLRSGRFIQRVVDGGLFDLCIVCSRRWLPPGYPASSRPGGQPSPGWRPNVWPAASPSL